MSGEGVRLRKSIYLTLTLVFGMWLVKIFEVTWGVDLGHYGILPRTLSGILTAPFIHGDAMHLISNTFPILILGVGLFYFYDKIALPVMVLIYLMTGFWVWVAAREAYHIGASGIVYGLLTFLLLSGFLRKDSRTLAISFIVLLLYGGSFVSGILPTEIGVSWESHLLGAVAGIFCAIYFKNSQAEITAEAREDINSHTTSVNYTYIYQEKPSTSDEIYQITIDEDDKSNTAGN